MRFSFLNSLLAASVLLGGTVLSADDSMHTPPADDPDSTYSNEVSAASLSGADNDVATSTSVDTTAGGGGAETQAAAAAETTAAASDTTAQANANAAAAAGDGSNGDTTAAETTAEATANANADVKAGAAGDGSNDKADATGAADTGFATVGEPALATATDGSENSNDNKNGNDNSNDNKSENDNSNSNENGSNNQNNNNNNDNNDNSNSNSNTNTNTNGNSNNNNNNNNNNNDNSNSNTNTNTNTNTNINDNSNTNYNSNININNVYPVTKVEITNIVISVKIKFYLVAWTACNANAIPLQTKLLTGGVPCYFQPPVTIASSYTRGNFFFEESTGYLRLDSTIEANVYLSVTANNILYTGSTPGSTRIKCKQPRAGKPLQCTRRFYTKSGSSALIISAGGNTNGLTPVELIAVQS